MKFFIHNQDKYTKARAGVINTDHGDIETPIFMPVGTLGTVKAVHQHELIQHIKAQIILSNAYHLYLRPGIEILKKAGGIHRFISWGKPILTDSGGFQVYSLSNNKKITEEGVIFHSHIDGSRIYFSPEKAISIQRDIGADIIMAFDECPPYPCQYQYAKISMERTDRWLKKCYRYFDNTKPLYNYNQNLFPIIQGSIYKDLRAISTEKALTIDSIGYSIGGLSVGEPKEAMYELTDFVCNILPKGKLRYLMGVGTPENILECIALGIDMFDCIMPTRNARNGMLFTTQGILNIKNAKWKDDFSSLDKGLEGYVSNTYNKAYLRHLMLSKEYLASQIASIHNLTFYLWLISEARKHIIIGDYNHWKRNAIKKLMHRI